jgi:hypothetical protein
LERFLTKTYAIANNLKTCHNAPSKKISTLGALMTISYFTPVNYLDKGGSFLQKTADDYFVFCRNITRAYVIGKENDVYKVVLVNTKSSLFPLALKVLSLFTVIIPVLMLCIKAIYRWNKQFSVQSIQSAAPFTMLYPTREQSPLDREAIKNKYNAFFAKIGLTYDQATPLQKHVIFFANENGMITRQSMQKGFERLHMGPIQASLLSYAVFKGLAPSPTATEIPVRDIHQMNHKSSTRAYDNNGEFDVTKFDLLQTFAKIDPTFLTADELATMRSVNSARDKNLPGATKGTIASKGEFGLLLTLFADRYVVQEYGNAIPAITFDKLRSMYLDGPMFFEAIAKQ